MLLDLFIRCELHLIKVQGSHPELRATEDLLRVRAKYGLQLPPFDLLGAAIRKVLFCGCLPSRRNLACGGIEFRSGSSNSSGREILHLCQD
jgi:hypothetical protein